MRLAGGIGVLVWIVAELWLLLRLADWIGGLGVLAVLIAGLIAGAALVRHGGTRAWHRLIETGGGDADGGMIALGGILIMIPGLITDVLGLACALPPTRGLLRRLPRRIARSAGFVLPAPLAAAYRQANRRGPRRNAGRARPGPGDGPTVITGEVLDEHTEPRR